MMFLGVSLLDNYNIKLLGMIKLFYRLIRILQVVNYVAYVGIKMKELKSCLSENGNVLNVTLFTEEMIMQL